MPVMTQATQDSIATKTTLAQVNSSAQLASVSQVTGLYAFDNTHSAEAASFALTNPLASTILVGFTNPGQSVTLPVMNDANSIKIGQKFTIVNIGSNECNIEDKDGNPIVTNLSEGRSIIFTLGVDTAPGLFEIEQGIQQYYKWKESDIQNYSVSTATLTCGSIFPDSAVSARFYRKGNLVTVTFGGVQNVVTNAGIMSIAGIPSDLKPVGTGRQESIIPIYALNLLDNPTVDYQYTRAAIFLNDSDTAFGLIPTDINAALMTPGFQVGNFAGFDTINFTYLLS